MQTNIFKTELGYVGVDIVNEQVSNVYFIEYGFNPPPTVDPQTFDGLLKRVYTVINSGSNDTIPVTLPTGTEFQHQVWKVISSIPRGKTMTYKDIAAKIGMPKAARAIANACGANPVPVLIPCHRVVRSDGSMGGYSGGIGIKKQLLAREGIKF